MDVSITEARDQLPEWANRVGYGAERVRVIRRGRPIVALVSIEDLKRLEEGDVTTLPTPGLTVAHRPPSADPLPRDVLGLVLDGNGNVTAAIVIGLDGAPTTWRDLDGVDWKTTQT